MSINNRLINTGGGSLVPLAIGDYVDDGIVIYVDPIINTTGIAISLVDFGTRALAYSGTGFSTDTPRGIWDATAATDQIISEFSGSTSFAAGRARSYLDGTWDLANRSMYGKYYANRTVVDSAITAAGGTLPTGVKHNCSDVYLQYDSNGYYYPTSGSSSIHNYTNTGVIRPMKYLGDGSITIFKTLRHDMMNNDYVSGRTRLQVAYDNEGTWTTISDSGDIYGGYPSYTQRGLGIPINTPLRFNALIGYGNNSQAGVRIYKTKDGYSLSDVTISSEGTHTLVEYTDYYQFQTAALSGTWLNAVLYATYS